MLGVAIAAAVWPADAAAQRHGHRTGARVSTVVVAGPAYYGYRYDPFFWGYPGWYPYGFYAPAYPAVASEQIGSARIQVTPRTADVYADGYLVGTVDDFDGFLQRLDLPPGEHELTFYQEGYRTVVQKVLFRPGATVRISYAMQPLPAGTSPEPRPQAPPPPPPGQSDPPAQYARPPRDDNDRGQFGTVAIRVQPADAAIFVDGEEWTGPEGQGPLLVDVAPGAHEVEARKEGFTTYRTTIRVRAGETTAVNVRLSR